MAKGIALTYTSFDKDVSKAVSASEYDIDFSDLKPNQVAIQALATPVNPSDLVQIQGVYTVPRTQTVQGKEVHIGGNEGLYQVVKVGESVKEFKAGDWAISKLPNFGTWRTHAVLDFYDDANTGLNDVPLIKIKDSTKASSKITISEAATIGVNPPTAYQILEQFVEFDNLGKDWVVQNAGASLVSKFVAQIAKHRKINVISVIRGGKPNHEEIVKELIDLGATKVITEEESQSEKFQTETLPQWLKETGGSLKLAVNSVGGKLASALFKQLSQDGVLVSYGVLDPEPISYSIGLQLYKNITTKAYWFTKNTKEDPESKVRTLNSVIELFESGDIKSVDFEKNVFKLGDSKEAFLDAYKNAIAKSSKGKQVVLFE